MVKKPKAPTKKKLTGFLAKRKSIVIGFIGVLGIATLLLTQAATGFSISIEPELGTPNGSAAPQNDTTASNGKYIKFGSSPPPSDDLLSNFFPIGAFQQPDGNFAMWKNRGINMFLETPQGANWVPANWAAKAAEGGYKVIASASAGSQSSVIGWHHQDEPDGICNQVPYSKVQQDYATMKAKNPNMPVFINFVGDLNQFDITGQPHNPNCQYNYSGVGGSDWYKKYIAGADWISADTYPVNQGRNLDMAGIMIDKLRNWSGNKPVFAIIESADYYTPDQYHGPNPAQLRAQVWSAIIHGVRGYIYFPIRLPPPNFSFDATPSDVAAEMTKQNSIVTSLTSVLQQGDINPGGMGATVPSGFEAGWRNHSSGKYFFILNLTNSAKNNQTITLNGIGSASSASVYQENRNVSISGGKITDNFAPYSVHIYKVQ